MEDVGQNPAPTTSLEDHGEFMQRLHRGLLDAIERRTDGADVDIEAQRVREVGGCDWNSRNAVLEGCLFSRSLRWQGAYQVAESLHVDNPHTPGGSPLFVFSQADDHFHQVNSFTRF